MIDFALDPNTGDLVFEDFDFALVGAVDQIAQNLAIRLRFIQGEWFLNILAGVPYYQYFFIKNPNQIQVETFLKNEISNTDGIIDITSFSSDFDSINRKFKVNFGCRSVNGNLEMEQILP
jgi:hypothetical protein